MEDFCSLMVSEEHCLGLSYDILLLCRQVDICSDLLWPHVELSTNQINPEPLAQACCEKVKEFQYDSKRPRYPGLPLKEVYKPEDGIVWGNSIILWRSTIWSMLRNSNRVYVLNK